MGWFDKKPKHVHTWVGIGAKHEHISDADPYWPRYHKVTFLELYCKEPQCGKTTVVKISDNAWTDSQIERYTNDVYPNPDGHTTFREDA